MLNCRPDFSSECLILVGHAADLLGKHVRHLEQPLLRRLVGAFHDLVEVRDGLVAHRTQAGSHHEHAPAVALVDVHFARRDALTARSDPRIGNADDAVLHYACLSKKSYLLYSPRSTQSSQGMKS